MWWLGRLCAFDLETTAPEPREARIVSAAVALCSGGMPTETHEWLVNPGVEIPQEAIDVHGITNEHVQELGMEPCDAVAELVDLLELILLLGWPLVIFNARYDLTTLHHEALRYGIVPLQDRVRIRAIDPLLLDKWLDRYRQGSRKLEEMCRHYRVTLDGAHDAAFDAIAAARLGYVIGARAEIVRDPRKNAPEIIRGLRGDWQCARRGPDEVHALQVRLGHQQAASLIDYFHDQRQFEDAFRVSLEWPIVSAR